LNVEFNPDFSFCRGFVQECRVRRVKCTPKLNKENVPVLEGQSMSRENMNQPELGNGVEVSGGSPRPPEICSGDEQSIIGTLRYRLLWLPKTQSELETRKSCLHADTLCRRN
jgi:hypothetical protein